MRYALFQHEAEAPDAAVVAQAFEHARGLTAFDAERMAAASEGVLVSGLSHDDARSIRPWLEQQGSAVEIVEEAWLKLPEITVCRRAAATMDAFVVYDMHGVATPIRWPDVKAAVAGVVRAGEIVRSKDMKVRHTTAGTEFEDAEYRYQERDELLLELVVDEPARRFRIVADRFDYGYLKGRKKTTSGENLALLVADIATYGSDAALGRGVHRLLADAKTTVRYRTAQRFEHGLCWLLWRHHGPGAARIDGAIGARSKPFGSTSAAATPTFTERARSAAADRVIEDNEADLERHMRQTRTLDAALSVLVGAITFSAIAYKFELEPTSAGHILAALVTFAIVVPFAWMFLRDWRKRKFWVGG